MSRQIDDAGTNGETTSGRRPSGKRKRAMTNSLVALSSAAVVAVYVAGYARTESAAASLISATPTASVAATAAPSARLIPTPPATAARSAAANTAPSTPTPARAAATATATTSAALRDGSYVGTGSSRHGSIEATVIIQGGKVTSAEITKCGTRYPCSRIASLPGQVVARQSTSVDVVSGATDSAVAYKAAVTAALAKAR